MSSETEELIPMNALDIHAEGVVDYAVPHMQKSEWPKGLIAFALFSSLLSFLSIIVVLSGQFVGLVEPPGFYEGGMRLPTANPYIGLEKSISLKEWESPFPDIINLPLNVAQVDRSSPNSVMTDAFPHWWTFQGTVLPDKRRIVITDTISTVVQHRVLDFGMELCQYEFAMDADEGRPMELLTGAHLIEVWLLASDNYIDVRKLTWNNRPPAKQLLGTLNVTEGGRGTTEPFNCTSGSHRAFELKCAQVACSIDSWQANEQPSRSFHLVQHFSM